MMFLPPLIALLSLLVWMHPPLAPLLLYDRGLVVKGEWWRLATGHLVHFSASHLCCDLCGLFIGWWWAWRRGYRGIGLVVVLSILCTGGTIFLLQPEMARYGGLSGIANSLIVYASCRGWRDNGRKGGWFAVAAVACFANGIYELITARGTLSSLASAAATPFVPAASVHLVGAAVGAILAFATSSCRSRSS